MMSRCVNDVVTGSGCVGETIPKFGQQNFISSYEMTHVTIVGIVGVDHHHAVQTRCNARSSNEDLTRCLKASKVTG